MNAKQGKKLIGRRIVMYESGRFKDERGWLYDPIIYLDDGSVLKFSVQEGGSEYGVRILRVKNGKVGG